MTNKKWRFTGLLVLALGFILGFQNPANAAPLDLETSRISGMRQIDTAIEVSKAGWPHNADTDTIILANCDLFPDALVAAPLSHKLNAPILLTPKGGVDAKVLQEIKRLGATNIIILGGVGALSSQVATDLQSAGLNNLERIFGYDQFETAQKVADRVGSKGQVILASGEQYPDALSIAAYAGATETPILLTQAKTMPKRTEEKLNSLQKIGALHTIVVGGEAVVSGATLGCLNSVPQRLSGNDQYDTAAAVFGFARGVLTSQTAYLVTGENFPDALAVGGLAAKQNAGIVMTQRPCLPASTYNLLSTSTASLLKVAIVGGSTVVPDRIKQILEGTVPNKPPGLLGGEIIVLDPGHGSPDPGAVGPAGTMEKDSNFAIAQKLASQLRAAGAVVYLTRNSDGSPARPYNKHDDLWSRVNIANALNATLFVSIHSNAGAGADGTETYYGMYPDFDNSSESYKLAKSIQDKLVNTIGLKDRGVKTGDFTVLNHFKMPAVLVEVAFISNAYEEQLLASDSFRQKAATGIYQGILAYKGL